MKAIGVILTSGVGAHVSVFAKVRAHGGLLRKVGAHSCAPLQLNEVLAA